MAEAKSIEAISLTFTVGALVGVTVSGGQGWVVASALGLAVLPVLLQRKLLKWPEPVSVSVLLLAFLLLGFCSAGLASSLMPPLPRFRPPGSWKPEKG